MPRKTGWYTFDFPKEANLGKGEILRFINRHLISYNAALPSLQRLTLRLYLTPSFTMDNSFTTIKIKTATIWTILGNVGTQGIRLASNLILTRLLAPELFGTMAIANLFLIGIALLSDVGLSQSMVRSKNAIKQSFINTVWSLQVIRGLLIGLFILFLSFIFDTEFVQNLAEGTAYAGKYLSYCLIGVAITAIISGFRSPYFLLLDRNLDIKKKVIIEITSQISGILLGITYALLINRDINALVIAMTTSALSSTLISYYFIDGKIKFAINKVYLGEILNYGKWIIVSSTLGYFIINGNQIILSFYFDIETMGIFTIAIFILMAISNIIEKVFFSVLFPMLSEASRHSEEKTKKVFLMIKKKIDPIVFFISAFLYSSGNAIINFLYDERYQEAGHFLSILSIGLISLNEKTISQLYFATGKSKAVSKMIICNILLLYISAPIVIKIGGLEYGIWAISLATASQLFIAYFYEYIYYKKIHFYIIPVILSVAAGLILGNIFSFLLEILKQNL